MHAGRPGLRGGRSRRTVGRRWHAGDRRAGDALPPRPRRRCDGAKRIEGIAALLEHVDCPIHVQRDEVPWVQRTTGVGDDHLAVHDPGDVVTVGRSTSRLIHTPGHTPGSQCFHVDGRLVSGDTLFLDGCGRTDLPGSNPEDMYTACRSSRRCRRHDRLPGAPLLTAVARDDGVDPREQLRATAPKSAEQWLQMFAG